MSRTTDALLDYQDRQAFEEDMRNMPEAPLTDKDLDKMYAEAMKDEECDNCLTDTLESHTHRDGPWEDETEEV